MVLPTFKLSSVFVRPVITAVLVCALLAPAYAQEGSSDTASIKSGRYFSDRNDLAGRFTLSPTSIFGPIYVVERDAGGNLAVTMPTPEYKETLYTNVVLAFLAHCVDNGISEGPFDRFIEKAIGGNDFEKCRIGTVQRVGNSYYALYLNDAGPQGPEMVYLKFTEAPKGMRPDKKSGAIVKLLDGTDILVESGHLRSAPKEYDRPDRERVKTVHEVSHLVLSGNTAAAAETLFTSPALQAGRLDVVADTCNKIIELAAGHKVDPRQAEAFLRTVMSDAAELLPGAEISAAVQLMAGQALTIISWNDARMPECGSMRLTADPEKMVSNDKHGKSFIDADTLPFWTPETKKEGTPGFFWRGAEKAAKLGLDKEGKLINAVEALIYDKERYEARRNNLIMYLMDHGFYGVNAVIREATENGTLSTMHETVFMNDLLPGSFQATSTGAGHFQETKVDLKRVTAGRGIQFNVRFNAAGDMVEVIGQEVKEGDWALALPGYVDYMVNLGGLKFNDISITLDAADAAVFAPGFDFSKENISAVKDAISRSGKKAPYAAANVGGSAYLVKTRDDAPAVRWIPGLANFTPSLTMSDMYSTLSTPHIKGFVKGLQASFTATMAEPAPRPDIAPFSENAIAGRAGGPAATLGKTQGIEKYIAVAEKIFSRVITSGQDGDILVRVPVEAVEAAGAANAKPFLAEIARAPRVYLELFTSSGMGAVSDAKYSEYGISRKALPEGFVPNRMNTITLMPVLNSEELSAKGRPTGDWGIGDMRPTDTILSPVGLANDPSGLARGLVFGLKLVEIARQVGKAGKADEAFLKETYEEYRSFCVSQGVKDFMASEQDLLSLAAGNINKVVEALNRLIKSMPIMPLNAEEIRVIYEHTREALIRA